jgi:hypothetical protein
MCGQGLWLNRSCYLTAHFRRLYGAGRHPCRPRVFEMKPLLSGLHVLLPSPPWPHCSVIQVLAMHVLIPQVHRARLQWHGGGGSCAAGLVPRPQQAAQAQERGDRGGGGPRAETGRAPRGHQGGANAKKTTVRLSLVLTEAPELLQSLEEAESKEFNQMLKYVEVSLASLDRPDTSLVSCAHASTSEQPRDSQEGLVAGMRPPPVGERGYRGGHASGAPSACPQAVGYDYNQCPQGSWGRQAPLGRGGRGGGHRSTRR